MNRFGAPREVRRSKCLIALWEGNEFILENYLTGKRTFISPIITQLLHSLENFRSESELLKPGGISGTPQLIEQLIDQDLLVVRGSATDQKETLLENSWEWGHSARYFHYATNSLDFECDPETQRRELLARLPISPPPSPYKDLPLTYPRIPLARRFEDRNSELWNTLRTRRTNRSFAEAPIGNDDFSDILLWTWGQTATFDNGEMGSYVLKTSPSGGARHPIEVYPIVLAVEGIASGIYHYSVRNHCLTMIRSGDFRELVVELCSGQAWLKDAAAVFFMTAVLERSMWKYRHAHTYRVVHLDAGHLGQTFHLVCTCLGLATFTTAATRNEQIERLLGLDGVSEIVLYTAAVGSRRE